jgi:hypothetical protein
MEDKMSMTLSHMTARETTYGWVADAIGGIAGLSGSHSETILAIATIVFGAALLIEGGTMITEYAR